MTTTTTTTTRHGSPRAVLAAIARMERLAAMTPKRRARAMGLPR